MFYQGDTPNREKCILSVLPAYHYHIENEIVERTRVRERGGVHKPTVKSDLISPRRQTNGRITVPVYYGTCTVIGLDCMITSALCIAS
jgi:hypothetical protein